MLKIQTACTITEITRTTHFDKVGTWLTAAVYYATYFKLL